MHPPTRQSTKTALIRSAERLFAEKGLGTVSVKEITRAAGARNPSAVHYHFGNVETLINQISTRATAGMCQSHAFRTEASFAVIFSISVHIKKN